MRKPPIFLAAALLILAACGGGSSTPTPAPAAAAPTVAAPTVAAPTAQEVISATLDIVMRDIYFGDDTNNMTNPPRWQVPAGAEVTVNLANKGGLEHNWAIIKQDVDLPIPFMPDQNGDLILWAADLLPAGGTATETFTAPTLPGEYLVICTVAGHYPAMQGRLVVE